MSAKFKHAFWEAMPRYAENPSVLDKDTRQFLRDQPICLPELFGSKCGEALKVASEDHQKQFILKAALGGPFRSPPLPNSQGGQRFVQERER